MYRSVSFRFQQPKWKEKYIYVYTKSVREIIDHFQLFFLSFYFFFFFLFFFKRDDTSLSNELCTEHQSKKKRKKKTSISDRWCGGSFEQLISIWRWNTRKKIFFCQILDSIYSFIEKASFPRPWEMDRRKKPSNLTLLTFLDIWLVFFSLL